jgi:hypothetical protein
MIEGTRNSIMMSTAHYPLCEIIEAHVISKLTVLPSSGD